jgi:CHAT domain-containing protein
LRPIVLLDREAGRYTIEVCSYPEESGDGIYHAKVLEARRAAAADFLAAGESLRRQAERRLDASASRESRLEAAADLERAVRCLERGGDERLLGFALVQLGIARSDLGERREAVASLMCAAETFFRVSDAELQVQSLIFLGTVLVHQQGLGSLGVLGQLQALLGAISRAPALEKPDPQAVEVLGHAVELAQRMKRPDIEAAARTTLSAAHFFAGTLQAALKEAESASALWPQDHVEERAHTFNLLAAIHLRLGNKLRAAASSAKALALLAQAPAKRDAESASAAEVHRAFQSFNRGLGRVVQDDLESVRQGLADLVEARRVWHDLSETEWEARTLSVEAVARRKLGQNDQGLELARQARGLFAARDNPLETALAQLVIADLLDQLGRPALAVDELQRALEAFTRLGLDSGRAHAHYGLARNLRALGEAAAASGHANEAVGLLERERSAVESRLLRLAYGSKVHEIYELAIDLQMELGAAEDALRTSELSRARTLLDSLSQAGLEAPARSDKNIRVERKRLQELLSVKEMVRLSSLRESNQGERLRELDEEIAELLERIDKLDVEMSAGGRPGFRSVGAGAFDLKRLQEATDEDTLLLEFALGETKSHGWVVWGGGVEGFSLPPRRTLEALAERVHGELSGRLLPEETGPSAAAELARSLLGPVAEKLEARKLLVAADGRLEKVPFAALPFPGQPAARLGDGRSVVAVPSATAFLLSSKDARSSSVRGLFLAVCQPAYSPPGAGSGEQSRRGPTPVRYAAGIARAVASWLPREHVRLVIGAEATRELVLGPEARGYRVLHFGAHGHFEPGRPDASALVLSLYDREGRELPGYLRRHDVLASQSDADIVVLAGCETGAGMELPGEGLVGLAAAFLHAGARSALASLWRVDDEATALLMFQFYEGLFRGRLTPSAALRRAQSWLSTLSYREREAIEKELSLPAARRPARAGTEGGTPYSHPYFWAGFTFIGDPDSVDWGDPDQRPR